MLYLIQIIKMLTKDQRQHLVALFDDLSYEIDEMGYRGNESDLIDDMLMNHFGLEMESDRQLQLLTQCILKHQGKLSGYVNAIVLRYGMKVA